MLTRPSSRGQVDSLRWRAPTVHSKYAAILTQNYRHLTTVVRGSSFALSQNHRLGRKVTRTAAGPAGERARSRRKTFEYWRVREITRPQSA
jgi:hypothetical protein